MTPKKFTASVCTLSWIDKRTELVENDGNGPPLVIPGYKVTREDDALPFRFLNLLEATISVVGSRVVSYNWTRASQIYRNPSFGNIPSEAFRTISSIVPHSDRGVFQQTVGARTVSPEVIGERWGGRVGVVTEVAQEALVVGVFGALSPTGIGSHLGEKSGRHVAHQFGYPPIWTKLELSLFADGRSVGAVLCHSLFPSMSFYSLNGRNGDVSRETSSYSLVGPLYDVHSKDDVAKWRTDGWGSLAAGASGPSRGNPWGLKKIDLTVRPDNSDRRTA